MLCCKNFLLQKVGIKFYKDQDPDLDPDTHFFSGQIRIRCFSKVGSGSGSGSSQKFPDPQQWFDGPAGKDPILNVGAMRRKKKRKKFRRYRTAYRWPSAETTLLRPEQGVCLYFDGVKRVEAPQLLKGQSENL
jgi:hypothetical protein